MKWLVPNILNDFLFFCSPTKIERTIQRRFHKECAAFNFWFAILYVHVACKGSKGNTMKFNNSNNNNVNNLSHQMPRMSQICVR